MAMISFFPMSSSLSVLDHPLIISLLVFVAGVCVCTRIYTGLLHSRAIRQNSSDFKNVAVIPYWVPFLGSVLSFARNVEGSCNTVRDTHSDGVVALQFGPTKYHLLTMPSLITQVFSQRTAVLSKEAVLTWFMKVAFDDRGTATKEPEAFHSSHKVLNLMLREKFITEATAATTALVEERAASLVTFWDEPETEGNHVWEKLGNVQVVDKDTADVDFYSLIVNFVGDVIVRVLFGDAFMDNNPKLLEDLWIFDEGVHWLLNGAFALTPSARKARAARQRLLDAMDEWQVALTKVQNGQDPGWKWRNMDKHAVSEVMALRVKGWEEHGASSRLRSSNDASVLWGANANSNKNIFWMLLQIFTRPTLLSDIREEVAPFVRVASSGSQSADSQSGQPKLDIDLEGLTKSCPLIKATFYETMRTNMSGIGVRHVKEDLTLTESASDASLFSKKRPQSYTIPAGSMLALSNGGIQQDPRIFPNPSAFNPGRFLFDNEKAPGEKVAQMKHLNTFGGGVYKCKGRHFAEKEMLIFVAAILTLWDVEEPCGGEVRVPEMGIAGAARSPKNDVRLRLRRRFAAAAPPL